MTQSIIKKNFEPDDGYLLAKNPIKRQDSTKIKAGCHLIAHTIDVVRAAESILEIISADLKRFFQLTDEQIPILWATVRLAAFCHDWGKANNGFQDMVRKKRKDQVIRHEHLSALMISLPEVRQWLQNSPEGIPKADFELVRLLVLGHHLKAVSRKRSDFYTEFCKFCSKDKDDDSFVVFSSHQQFSKLLKWLCREPFNLPDPIFVIPDNWTFSKNKKGIYVRDFRDRILAEFGQIEMQLSKDESRLRLFMAARVVVLSADAVASGLRRISNLESSSIEKGKEVSQKDWITLGLLKGKTAQDIESLLEKRKAQIIERKIKQGITGFSFEYQKFQTQAATLGDRALLLAPCGSGKTIAAYLWIQKQLESHAGWKAIFLYPTTGTATEGFKDYASHDDDAALLHGRAEFDLKGMFKNPDERSEKDFLADKRLFALGYWHDAIFSATADAFLGFMQNNYSSLCLLPLLVRSVVVIDEIHSFDAGMFSALIEFLEKFNIPVLLMTASIQNERLKLLKKKIPSLKVYPTNEDMKDLDDLQESADAERYSINFERNNSKLSKENPYPEELLQIAQQAYRDGYKILWVVNTVARCILIARLLEHLGVYCYHSRFMYTDRVAQHRDVVEAFQSSKAGGAIAVTTQVCEMSLDLDAAVLITELAPASSLIQRMGRCNRKQLPANPNKFGKVYIYNPIAELPYASEAINSGSEMLSKLDLSKPIRQTELSKVLESINLSKEREKNCLFTTATWEAYSPNDFRDIENHTVSALLESKVGEYKRLQATKQSTAGIILQAPKSWANKKENGIWLPIVPDETESIKYKYCKRYGLREE
ncbi:MAG: CRISPR-associated helicase Cas3' [Pseudanabaena sp. M135S2SP2A07QC]|nr:CRISPR-associated helicase Cas3' [Pseudanabaena sp. M051S1SP2A07QC]MCA6531614.1 CRISPR-associated helicase Cas3' [Pseudanabaena sp. M125S2SP2A07QC]MCA6536603.1 CRISPR-associated helicase Cas3' [Pseudanabaena sp. M176S2SP2A07QC]MCA6541091.1 CRISPR-associated helicase Cas3' [Pseudanabaena sp. M037S2SP2A07QC]MCA6541955.1 CRISPR-associated helicase Cas3' [Pseudanabaena sp. M074S1SP2A07QC]MCA6548840.1 CRISPR-associated helicase Cas3' [Pseudanabaena sp. M152S2SP2A07QC]MCA6552785.1 CRISPR-associa